MVCPCTRAFCGPMTARPRWSARIGSTKCAWISWQRRRRRTEGGTRDRSLTVAARIEGARGGREFVALPDGRGSSTVNPVHQPTARHRGRDTAEEDVDGGVETFGERAASEERHTRGEQHSGEQGKCEVGHQRAS